VGGDKRTVFGSTIQDILVATGSSQAALASGIGCSRSYVNHTMAGRKVASPEWVNLVADTLKLSEDKRAELHRAAAKDAGYEIDLTK